MPLYLLNMRKISRLVFLFLMVFPWLAFACDDRPIITAQKNDGSKIGLVIPKAMILAAPEWVPGTGEPPLSFSKAYEFAVTWAKTEYSKYDNIAIREISLSRYGCSSVKNRWFYQFAFIPSFDGNELWGAGNFAAVLMDGTVIGPVEMK